MTTGKNPFAESSHAYAQARPRYPRELFDWILANTRRRDTAWDCATGNGQAAVDLAPHFGTIHATDVSPEQLQEALRAPNVVYSVQPAERTTFADDSFDLVTVAQALHWFDLARFWPEVTRVARPGAFFCAWGYARLECDRDVQAELVAPFEELVRPCWAPNNAILWAGYRDQDIAFPLQRATPPELAIRTRWTVEQLIVFLQTWSAYRRSQASAEAARALSELMDRARPRLGERRQLEVSMPLAIAAGRVTK